MWSCVVSWLSTYASSGRRRRRWRTKCYRLFQTRDEELARGATPSPTFIFIDEAHYYFPQEGAREDFNKEVVEAVINKLTRLGRVRRMGVVFATHSPADLNDLVIQLTNTKIAMRGARCLNAWLNTPGVYALAVAKSFIYTPWPSKHCRPGRDTEESSDPRRSVAPSLGVCQRASQLLYSWRASGSSCPPRLRGRDAGIQLYEGERAERSASQGTSASSRRLGGSRPAPVPRLSRAAAVGGGVQRRFCRRLP